jgi:sensor histidine kinase regulating citrate/malate metabolism
MILDKLRRARKAVAAAAASLGTAVIAFIPAYDDEYKVGVGVVLGIISAAIVYFTPNRS